MDQAEPDYQIAVFKDVMVPMRDGVRLATDVYRPVREGELLPGPFPAILARTSYDKTAQRYVEPIGHFFAERGYVVALQDLRGRHHSEGTGQYFHTANQHEGRDGYDTIEWLAAQPWSNGQVGMVGTSHVGLVQTHAALYQPPHLAAIWPDVSPTNSYEHQARMGGAMQLQMFGALFVHAHDAQEIRDDLAAQRAIVQAMEHMRDLVYTLPFKPGHTPLAVVPNLEKTLLDYYRRGAYDEFWAAEFNDFSRRFDRHADIPATFTGGWFDLFAIATPRYYAAMAQKNSTPQRLIMGPWMHTTMRSGVSYAGDVDFGPAGAWGTDRFNAEQLRWFERWLKGQPTGVEDEPPVRIFVMGGGDGHRTSEGHMFHGGSWRDEYEWPLARTVYTPFYCQPGGGLRDELPPEDAPTAHFSADPAHPVPTIAGSMSGLNEVVPLSNQLDPYWSQRLPLWPRMRSMVMEGAAHQQERPGIVGARPPYLPLAMRPDVLVFQTEPLPKDIEVTGPIEVHLWVASSAADTDFTAKLVDVYPPNADYPEGYHMNLVDGILRCRYRESWEHEILMEAGEVYQVRIELAPTSNLFQAGHRIRLDIAGSNFPRFDVNPNTGEPIGRHTHTLVAHNSVYLDRERPSHVVLPIITH
jgi:uncharacterized protein